MTEVTTEQQITWPLDEPFYSGPGAVAIEEVGLPCAVNGRGFLIDFSDNAGYLYRFRQTTVNLLNTQQAASGGDQSQVPPEVWRRSIETWVGGAGQSEFDRTGSDPTRFRSSQGVDVFTPWQVSLLHDTELIQALPLTTQISILPWTPTETGVVAGTHRTYAGQDFMAAQDVPTGIGPLPIGDGSAVDRAILLSMRCGYAQTTTGGHAYPTLMVSNSNPGLVPGSFRQALADAKAAGGGYIVFTPGGTFDINFKVSGQNTNVLAPSNTTINGWGANVTFRGFGVRDASTGTVCGFYVGGQQNSDFTGYYGSQPVHDVIVTGIRFDCFEGTADSQGDMVAVRYWARNIWFDHCFMTNPQKLTDGLCDVSGGSNSVTFSWCDFYKHHKAVLAQSNPITASPTGNQLPPGVTAGSPGPYTIQNVGGVDEVQVRVSYINCLFDGLAQRSPLMKGEACYVNLHACWVRNFGAYNDGVNASVNGSYNWPPYVGSRFAETVNPGPSTGPGAPNTTVPGPFTPNTGGGTKTITGVGTETGGALYIENTTYTGLPGTTTEPVANDSNTLNHIKTSNNAYVNCTYGGDHNAGAVPAAPYTVSLMPRDAVPDATRYGAGRQDGFWDHIGPAGSVIISDGHAWLTTVGPDQLVAGAGGDLYWWDTDLDATPTHVTSPEGDVLDTCTDGGALYTLSSGGVVRRWTGPGASSVFASGVPVVAGATIIRFLKGFLVVAAGSSLYDISTGTPALIYTHFLSDFRWVDGCEGSAAAFLVGGLGDRWHVYAMTPLDDATTFNPPLPVAPIPDGEVAYSIASYLGYIFVGLNVGWRFGVPDAGNQITLGRLVATDNAVRCFEGQDRFVWYGQSADLGTPPAGLGRADLSTFTSPLTPAYANDLSTTLPSGVVRRVATFGAGPGTLGRRVFTVDGAGVYAETDDLVPSGWLRTGVLSYNTSDAKQGLYAQVYTQPLRGSVGVDAYYDRGAVPVTLTTTTTTGAISAGKIPVSANSFQTFEPRFTLTRDPVNPTLGPVLTRFELRCLPVAGRATELRIPLVISQDYDNQGAAQVRDPQADVDWLMALVQTKEAFVLRVGTRRYRTYMVDFAWLPEKLDEQGQALTGMFVVVARELA